MDRELREFLRSINRHHPGAEDVMLLNTMLNRIGRQYSCKCLEFHKSIICEIPNCTRIGFLCDPEYDECDMCETCKSNDHYTFGECSRCYRKGCRRHFSECMECGYQFCDNFCLNSRGICRGIRIESSMPGILPAGYRRGCADH